MGPRMLRWYSSYVIFSFWYLGQNRKEAFEAIHQSYPSDKNEYNIAFEVEPAYFCGPDELIAGVKLSGTDTNGAVCAIWASGWGSNTKESQDRWAHCIEDVIDFFTDPPASLNFP
jgi:hypothetical protein